MFTVRGGLAHQRSCERRTRPPLRDRTGDGVRESSERRRHASRGSTGGSHSPTSDRARVRDSVAGGVTLRRWPPRADRSRGRRPTRELRSRRSRIRGPCQGEGEAEVAKVLCVLYEDPVDGYPSRTLERRFPGSSATTTVRRRRPPSGSTSSRVSFWAAFPGSSGCGGSSRSAATRLLSRRTRTGRTRSSSESSRTLRSSSPSRSGLPT